MEKTVKYFIYRKDNRRRTGWYYDNKADAAMAAGIMNFEVGGQKFALATAYFHGDRVLRTEPAGLVTEIA